MEEKPRSRDIVHFLGLPEHVASLCAGATQEQWQFACAAVELAASDAERNALSQSPEGVVEWLMNRFDSLNWYKRVHRCELIMKALAQVAWANREREAWMETVGDGHNLINVVIPYRHTVEAEEPDMTMYLRVQVNISMPRFGKIGEVTWTRLYVFLKEVVPKDERARMNPSSPLGNPEDFRLADLNDCGPSMGQVDLEEPLRQAMAPLVATRARGRLDDRGGSLFETTLMADEVRVEPKHIRAIAETLQRVLHPLFQNWCDGYYCLSLRVEHDLSIVASTFRSNPHGI